MLKIWALATVRPTEAGRGEAASRPGERPRKTCLYNSGLSAKPTVQFPSTERHFFGWRRQNPKDSFSASFQRFFSPSPCPHDVSGSGLTLCHVPEKWGMDGQRQRGRASRHIPPNNTDQGPGHFCYESAIGFYAANALGTSLGTYFYLLSAMLVIMELTQNAHGFVPSQMITPAR